MDVAKQRIRAAAARKKEERMTKGAKVGDSSVPKTVSKTSKRKVDVRAPVPPRRPSPSQVTPPQRGNRPSSQATVQARG